MSAAAKVGAAFEHAKDALAKVEQAMEEATLQEQLKLKEANMEVQAARKAASREAAAAQAALAEQLAKQRKVEEQLKDQSEQVKTLEDLLLQSESQREMHLKEVHSLADTVSQLKEELRLAGSQERHLQDELHRVRGGSAAMEGVAPSIASAAAVAADGGAASRQRRAANLSRADVAEKEAVAPSSTVAEHGARSQQAGNVAATGGSSSSRSSARQAAEHSASKASGAAPLSLKPGESKRGVDAGEPEEPRKSAAGAPVKLLPNHSTTSAAEQREGHRPGGAADSEGNTANPPAVGSAVPAAREAPEESQSKLPARGRGQKLGLRGRREVSPPPEKMARSVAPAASSSAMKQEPAEEESEEQKVDASAEAAKKEEGAPRQVASALWPRHGRVVVELKPSAKAKGKAKARQPESPSAPAVAAAAAAAAAASPAQASNSPRLRVQRAAEEAAREKEEERSRSRGPKQPGNPPRATLSRGPGSRLCLVNLTGVCTAGDACKLRHATGSERQAILDRMGRTECRTGVNCRRPGCVYKHPEGWVPPPRA